MWATRLINAAKTAITPKSVIAVQNEALLAAAKLRADKLPEIDLCITRILTGEKRYRALANEFENGMPWWFIAITHFMEAGWKYPKHFNYHLHCGDPLTGRTFNVPRGRPKFNPGQGSKPPSPENPYSWHESAKDAIQYMGYDDIMEWSEGNCLYLFEKYNGWGYKNRGIRSPYVWNYTTLYGDPPHIGKYLSDGKFYKYHPSGLPVLSKQPGTASLLMRMKEKDIV